MPKSEWPVWWKWEIELSPHLFKRMDDRRLTEIDLRDMLERASGYYQDIVEGRYVILSKFRRKNWEIIVEPDNHLRLLVIITAYPLE